MSSYGRPGYSTREQIVEASSHSLSTLVTLKSTLVNYLETGEVSQSPSATVKRVESFAAFLGIDAIEHVDRRYTDGVPIVRINKASERAKCHRALHFWSEAPSALNNPTRETYGKGLTPEQSQASAMMEAVERFCAQRFEHHDVVYASSNELGDSAMPLSRVLAPMLPLKCLRCPAREVRCFHDVAKVADEWCWGYSLLSDRAVLVPAALVYYPYLSEDGYSYMYNDTGGLAAGNTLEEATWHALAEVFERDSLYSVFSCERTESLQMVSVGQSDRSRLRELLDDSFLEDGVFVFRLRNDIVRVDIDIYCAFVCYEESGRRSFFGGSGASRCPSVGMLRALTELQQQKVRQNQLREFPRDSLIRFSKAEFSMDRLLPIGEIKDCSSRDVLANIMSCVGQLAKRDMDVIVVNLTHPDIGIPVVRVIVPGLIGYSGNLIKETTLFAIMRAFGGRSC